ncbi:hypothetical protein [Sphingomonas sp. BE138]|uniref:hypothetical protein n=1 Tax=Sphingomonas sp. BE138 TaxID=2817845 RepID=UPI00286B8707|nr:hypothetical protein [Sphingomonas sp. BE138]
MHLTSRVLTAPTLDRPATKAASATDAVPVVDNPFAPELFMTGVSGFANLGGVVGITLESARADHSHPQPRPERMVVARLLMSIPTAQMLVTALNHYLEAQGHSPSKAMAADATFQ